MKIERFCSLLTILILVSSLSACGGGGSGTDTGANPPAPTPGSNPPTDPTTTAEWAALVAGLDSRFTTDRNNLNAEQAADNGPLGGNYYAAARDRFTGYVDGFWDYAYDETLRLSNNSSLTFKQGDVSALLDDYRQRWLSFMDQFIDGLPLIDTIIRGAIRPVMAAAVSDGFTDTMNRLSAWLVQYIPQTEIAKIQGSWTSSLGDLNLTIQADGSVLGYDVSGCQIDGVVVTNELMNPDFRLVARKKWRL